MEEETLRTTAEGARYLDEYAERIAGKDMETFLREEAAFEDGMNRWNEAAEQFKKENPDA